MNFPKENKPGQLHDLVQASLTSSLSWQPNKIEYENINIFSNKDSFNQGNWIIFLSDLFMIPKAKTILNQRIKQ